jgi:acetyl-CoA carboxylase carboxyltransferase component
VTASSGKAAREGKLGPGARHKLSTGSFVESSCWRKQCTDFGMAEKNLPSDGVVTGFGKIDSRPVYVFSQDRAVLAGTVGSAHAEKIAYVIQTARKLGVPLIGLNDSAGARIQEGLSVTTAIGKIFFENSIASGCIPRFPRSWVRERRRLPSPG